MKTPAHRIARIDSNNFAVQKYVPERTSDKGQVIPETWIGEFYYNTLESLCMAYLNVRAVGSDAKTLLEEIKLARAEIREMLEAFKGTLDVKELRKPEVVKEVVGRKPKGGV